MKIENIRINKFKNGKNEEVTWYQMTVSDEENKIYHKDICYGVPVYTYKVSRRALNEHCQDGDVKKLVNKKIDNVYIDWKQQKIKKIYFRAKESVKI